MKYIIAFIFATLAPLAAHAQTVTVGEDWGVFGLTGDDGSEFYVRYDVVVDNGKIFVCAAANVRGGMPRRVAREMLRHAFVEFDDNTKIVSTMSFAKLHASNHRKNDLVGFEAKCKTSRVAPPEGGFRYGMDIRQGSVYRVR